jgi:hypothetical protein
MQNHTHTHTDYRHHWYIRTRLQCGHIFMMQNAKSHTHTDYNHHWYIRTWLQCSHIFMTRYAKSHTHIDLARRSSILLVGRRSCYTWSLNKLHLCWWLRKLIPALQLDHKAFWTCTFGLQEHSAKTMIIGHRRRDCSSWKQWSLDTWWNCSSWCQEVLGYLPRTRLRGRGMSQGFFWQLRSRDEQPNHPLSQEFF